MRDWEYCWRFGYAELYGMAMCCGCLFWFWFWFLLCCTWLLLFGSFFVFFNLFSIGNVLDCAGLRVRAFGASASVLVNYMLLCCGCLMLFRFLLCCMYIGFSYSCCAIVFGSFGGFSVLKKFSRVGGAFFPWIKLTALCIWCFVSSYLSSVWGFLESSAVGGSV